MPTNNEEYIKAFQTIVLENVRHLTASVSESTIMIDGVPIPSSFYGDIVYEYDDELRGKGGGPGIPSKRQKRKYTFKQRHIEQAISEARQITQSKDIREILCPALNTVSQDVIEVSKVVTPILLGASLAKIIEISHDSLLFAVIAIVIVRTGVAILCRDYPKDDKKDKSKSSKRSK